MTWTLLFAGLVIGSNNFAASIAIGALGGKKYRFKIITVFAIFEFFIPLLGVWLGEQMSAYVGQAAGLVSVLILIGLATVSIYSATKPPRVDERILERITTIRGLVLLELGLSLDNLIAGFSLGLNGGNVSPLLLAATIVVFSAAYSFVGLSVGHRLAKKWQNYAQFGAGILLLVLAALSWFDMM